MKRGESDRFLDKFFCSAYACSLSHEVYVTILTHVLPCETRAPTTSWYRTTTSGRHNF